MEWEGELTKPAPAPTDTQGRKIKTVGHLTGKSGSIDLEGPENRLTLVGVSTGAVTAKLDGTIVATHPGGNISVKGIRLGQGVLTIDCKGEMDAHYSATEVRLTEYVDNEAPPAPKPPMNILAQMRSAFRAQMGVSREPFENDTGYPGHEIDDDVEPMFEEEKAAHDAQLRKEAIEARKAKEAQASEAATSPPEGESPT